MQTITVHADLDAFYNSLYMKGLLELFPRRAIRYSLEPFPRSFSHHLAFIVHDRGGQEHKVFLCHRDYATYHEDGLRWCDVYGKVNIDPAALPAVGAEKLVPIGPNFGVRLYPAVTALYRACTSFRPGDSNPREHFANYYRQARYGVPEQMLTPGTAVNDYAFFAGSLWHEDPEANRVRAAFLEACTSIAGLRFEGGFMPTRLVRGYERWMLKAQYQIAEYIDNTKKSVVVFNNPAYAKAHSWRLGEYLALGKAIVSTPLARALPAPLVHGTHIHYVEGSVESIRTAIQIIQQDPEYRRSLERNAREYFLRYVQPSAVMRRVLDRAGVAIAA